MGNDFFESFLRNSTNYENGVEFFEDTHDEHGNYIGKRAPSNFGYTASVNGVPAQGAQSGYTQPQGYNQPQGYAQPQQNYSQPQGYAQPQQSYNQPQQAAQNGNGVNQATGGNQNAAPQARPLPTAEQTALQLGRNFVIYRPRTTADVEQLIAYLRRGEPALADLDPISDSPDAQRLMDFTSGAAYALGDRVITVRRNLFLITPDSMEVLKPERDD